MSVTPQCDIYAITDRGNVRRHNEDALFLAPKLGVAVVADGMGGYHAGEIASSLAVTVLSEEMNASLNNKKNGRNTAELHRVIESGIEKANQIILNTAQAQTKYANMGTTIVMFALAAKTITVAHVGDSRCYRMRNRKLQRITKDHSMVQSMIDSGFMSEEEAKYSNNRHSITKALGWELKVNPNIVTLDIEQDDIYMLCSDGLSSLVDDPYIESMILQNGPHLDKMASLFVQESKRRGGDDNITVVLAQVRQRNTVDSWWKRPLTWVRSF